MKKLKKHCVSLFISVLLLPCICCSLVVSAIDPATVIETAVMAIELTVATANALSDSDEQLHQENVTAMTKALDNQTGLATVTVLKYAFVTGKSQVRYLCTDNTERSFNVEVSMYYLENYDGAVYGDSTLSPIVNGKDGLKYIANNMYFDIWYSDGFHYRIRYKPDDYLSFAQQFNSNAFGTSGQLLLTIFRPVNGRFFDVSDGDLFGTELTTWGNSTSSISFYSVNRNSIVTTPQQTWYDNSGNKYKFNNTTTDTEIDPTRNMSLGYYPTPKQICFNSYNFTSYYSSGSTTSNGSPFYVGAFFDTNYTPWNTSYNNMNSSKKDSNIFYYDNTVVGGTTIDNSNKTTVLGGILVNDFDVNGLFTGIANLQGTIKPLLDISLPDITSKVTNYFENMPDWNTTWDTQRDNDYYLIPWDDLPPDNPSGDITVLVTVDVSRPLVPEFTTSSRWLYIDVGNMTTTVQAIQPEYVTAAQTLQGKTDSVFNELELIPLYLGLAIFGVAVSVLFKGV